MSDNIPTWAEFVAEGASKKRTSTLVERGTIPPPSAGWVRFSDEHLPPMDEKRMYNTPKSADLPEDVRISPYTGNINNPTAELNHLNNLAWNCRNQWMVQLEAFIVNLGIALPKFDTSWAFDPEMLERVCTPPYSCSKEYQDD